MRLPIVCVTQTCMACHTVCVLSACSQVLFVSSMIQVSSWEVSWPWLLEMSFTLNWMHESIDNYCIRWSYAIVKVQQTPILSLMWYMQLHQVQTRQRQHKLLHITARLQPPDCLLNPEKCHRKGLVVGDEPTIHDRKSYSCMPMLTGLPFCCQQAVYTCNRQKHVSTCKQKSSRPCAVATLRIQIDFP